jgi:precorrin-8X/cobalt-precorrin-8 methylmutase
VTTLFDSYVAVDWSASNKPTSGKDSIWSCVGDELAEPLRTTNHRTRRAAEAWLLDYLTVAVRAGRRVLVGLDFPYGYPAGFAAALELRGEPWRAVWTYLEGQIADDAHNVSNRFEVAARINEQLGRHAPFWGRPKHLILPSLPFRKAVAYHAPERGGLSEWRQAEQELQRLKTRPQPVWKLAGAGAVGSQSLVGIPVVARLRDHEALRDVSRVWPFEVRVPDLRAGLPAVVHAEIWPTIVPFDDELGAYRDEKQVRAVVRHWRELDRASRLANLFAAAPAQGVVQGEEGWVLGAPAPGTPIAPRPRRRPRSTSELGMPPANAASASNTRQPCLCGCGDFPRGRYSRFMPGHDQRINPATGRRFNAH